MSSSTPLRHQTFYSLEDLNAAIRKQLVLANQRPLKGKEGTRQSLFEAHEKPLLKPLLTASYEIKRVTEGKVQRNYHVILGEDRHQYSVPHTLIGRRMKIVYTTETAEIYDGLKRVALHKRSYKKHGYTTQTDHMPAHHQHVSWQRGWDPDYFKEQAVRIGPATAQVIEKILASRAFHEQSYTSCLGILRLAPGGGLHTIGLVALDQLHYITISQQNHSIQFNFSTDSEKIRTGTRNENQEYWI